MNEPSRIKDIISYDTVSCEHTFIYIWSRYGVWITSYNFLVHFSLVNNNKDDNT